MKTRIGIALLALLTVAGLSAAGAKITRDSDGNGFTVYSNLTVLGTFAGSAASAITNLDDVSLSDPVTDGHVLAWDSTAGVWTNSAAGAGTGDFLADGTVPMTGDLNMDGNVIWAVEGITSSSFTNTTATPSTIAVWDANRSIVSGTIAEADIMVAAGTVPMTGNLNLDTTNRIVNVADGTGLQDAVTLSQLQSAVAGNQEYYFTTVDFPGISLTGTVKSTNYASVLLPDQGTNAAVTAANGDYLAAYLTTNTYSSLAGGLAHIELYAWENSIGTGDIKAEVYIVNSVTMADEYEFEPSPAYQTVPSTTTPTKLVFSVPVTEYSSTTNFYVAVKVKVQEDGNDPTIRLTSGGIYPAHISFNVPGGYFLSTATAAATYQPLDTDLTRFGGIGAGAEGDVLYRDATGWTNLVAGTDGEVLKLASGIPSWAADETAAGGEASGTVHAPDGATTANRIALFKDTTGTNITQAAVGISDLQAADADLTTWAGITPGANVGTFLATPSSANFLSAVTDETGSGGVVASNAPSIYNLTVTGALQGDLDLGDNNITNVGALTVTDLNVETLTVTNAIDGVNLTNIPNLEVTTGLIIPANSIALATDTTGNYVATIADSGASEITVANSGAENAAVTLALASGITRDTELTANTNLLHLNVGTLTVTNQFKTLWNNVTLDGTNAVLDLKLSPNFYWSTTTSNFLTFSNITAGAQGSILIYTPDSGGEEINFSSSINNLSTNRYAPVFQSTNQTWIGYSVTFGTDLTNVTVGITVK
jgi:hypothetical protein